MDKADLEPLMENSQISPDIELFGGTSSNVQHRAPPSVSSFNKPIKMDDNRPLIDCSKCAVIDVEMLQNASSHSKDEMDCHKNRSYWHTSNHGDLSAAQVWPCRACGILLGVFHLLLGITLLLFDILTNNVSETAFAITAALAFIVCALLSFIAARRLDRPAQLLLLFFSLFALAMSTTMFIESAAVINHNCDHGNCHGHENIVHTILLCFALVELTVSLVTIMVCFRSLRKAYGVNKAASPYSTLIEGDYNVFRIKPRTNNVSHSVMVATLIHHPPRICHVEYA